MYRILMTEDQKSKRQRERERERELRLLKHLHWNRNTRLVFKTRLEHNNCGETIKKKLKEEMENDIEFRRNSRRFPEQKGTKTIMQENANKEHQIQIYFEHENDYSVDQIT